MSVDYWETFMSLLRAGLWEQDLELPCTPDVDAWELVLSLGRVQAVMGLVVRGIAHLPEEQRDLEELEPVLQAIKEALSRANHTYARVQVTLFQILAESRLHPIIQKGSEAAKYYADPSVRLTDNWLKQMDYRLLPRISVGGTVTWHAPFVEGLSFQLSGGWIRSFKIAHLGGKNREIATIKIAYDY